jgi:hypothetical protein
MANEFPHVVDEQRAVAATLAAGLIAASTSSFPATPEGAIEAYVKVFHALQARVTEKT